jgi:sulfate adenylyltransferase
MSHGLIPPHGGTLVDLLVTDDARRSELAAVVESAPRIKLPAREQCDVELLAVGAMSPLTGFMGEADFNGVCEKIRLASGQPWSVPITCSVRQGRSRQDRNRPARSSLTDDADRPARLC